ncbi:PAS domain-containing sensor histidine kinase [Pseudoduganella sp. LjRoot289]|uniref:PAS domain-containing sensor histidine kinase n=1 Tax=Pseudoduganella sp. LjRoot289 TaxID=3342314 RepID=UPI003ECDFD9C
MRTAQGNTMPIDFAKLISEESPDAVILTAPGGAIVGWTRGAQAMFGYTEQEALGRRLGMLLPPGLCDDGDAIERHVFEHGQAHYESLWHHKDGTPLPVDCVAKAVAAGPGRDALVLSAVRFATGRQRMEQQSSQQSAQQSTQQLKQQLSESHRELRDAHLAKDRFLASMSHELRTPLNAIIGFAGTLLMRLPGPLTPEQERQLRTVQASARQLLALINDLLDLTKIASGKVELNMEALECHALISELLPVFQPQAHQKGLQFDFSAPDDDINVHGDRRAMQQILVNLLTNAIKYTDSGAVRIELDTADVNGRACATVSVCDTGVGIAPDHQQMLCQAFSQIGEGPALQFEGTGLGLHLSQRLAHLLHGQISFESRQGAGSVFTLAVPLEA